MKLIIRFQQLAETGNMQRESLDQLKQLQLQFSSLAAAEEAAQSSSTQPQVGSKRKSTAASKLSNQQIQQHQPQIEIPVELTKQASSVVRLINNSHERVATLYKGLFISTPFSPGRVVELYPVDQRLVVQLSFGKLYSTFSKALSWGKLSSAATTTSDTDLTKVEPSSNHLSLESVPTHILDELDMESIVKSVESIIAASHINTPHTTQLEVDRLLAQAIKDAKTQITTNTTETNTTPMEVTDSSQKIEANHSIPIVEDSTNIPQAVLQNDPSTSSSSNINNRPTYVLKNRHIPASDVLLATTPLSLVTELIRRLPSELRLMPSAFRPHIDSKTVTDGLSPSGVISSSSSEHLGRNPIHLYPNQVPSQVLQPKMASSSVDPQISRDRILLQE